MSTNPIESLRHKAGMTMQELADLVGTTAPQINKLEKGQRDLDKKWAMRIAPYLGVTAEDLMFPKRGKFAQKTGRYKQLQEAPVYGVSTKREKNYPLDRDHVVATRITNLASMGGRGFYVTVVGNDMMPLFEEGQILGVNPDAPLEKGKPCVIETINNETLIRKFISQGAASVRCEQLKPARKETIKLAEIVRISRVVSQEF